MDREIKSGSDVIREFMSEIYNVENAEKSVVDMLVHLYDEDKLTDKNIQNALEALLSIELKSKEGKNE